MQQKILRRVSLIFIFLTFSCSSGNDIKKEIIGKWKMTKVKELSEDVTQRHNPDKDRWIRFKEDDETFESGKGDTKGNSGKWSYNEKENELYLDSDAGEDDDSYWSVTIIKDTMVWKGRKFEFNKRFEIEYSRDE